MILNQTKETAWEGSLHASRLQGKRLCSIAPNYLWTRRLSLYFPLNLKANLFLAMVSRVHQRSDVTFLNKHFFFITWAVMNMTFHSRDYFLSLFMTCRLSLVARATLENVLNIVTCEKVDCYEDVHLKHWKTFSHFYHESDKRLQKIIVFENRERRRKRSDTGNVIISIFLSFQKQNLHRISR